MNLDDWENNFGHNFLLLRQEHHLTQKQMAEKLNISLYAVQKIERGTPPLRLGAYVLINIYLSFGVLSEDMFKDKLG